MRIGELRHKIIIQKLISGVNENGFPASVWVSHKTVWASVNNLSGREYFAAMAVQSGTMVDFCIRYLADIDARVNIEGVHTTEAFRIKFGNLIYDIDFIDNVKYARGYMNIKALAVV